MRTPLEALEVAVRVLGSQQALADALSVKQPSISQWRQRGVIPEDRCAPIEALVAARWPSLSAELQAELVEPVRCEEMRPELGWRRDEAGTVVAVVRPIDAVPVALLASQQAGPEAAVQ